jgi:hypothetical protein
LRSVKDWGPKLPGKKMPRLRRIQTYFAVSLRSASHLRLRAVVRRVGEWNKQTIWRGSGGPPSRQVRAFLRRGGVPKPKGRKIASAYEFESA